MGLAVLAITMVTVVVFFPVTLLYGVSNFLFTALALASSFRFSPPILSPFPSCRFTAQYLLKGIAHHGDPAEELDGEPAKRQSWGARFHAQFNAKFERMLDIYDLWVSKALDRPQGNCLGDSSVLFVLSFALYPFVGVSFFPRTDAGQFIINVKAPTGTRIEVTEDYVKKVESIVRQVVRPDDLNTVVSNIGVMPDLSSLFTPNAGCIQRSLQVGLKEDHKVGSLRLHGRGAQTGCRRNCRNCAPIFNPAAWWTRC